MKLILKKPTSQRRVIQLNRNNLVKKSIIKKNIKGFRNSSGRKNIGKITVRYKGGGGHKKIK